MTDGGDDRPHGRGNSRLCRLGRAAERGGPGGRGEVFPDQELHGGQSIIFSMGSTRMLLAPAFLSDSMASQKTASEQTSESAPRVSSPTRGRVVGAVGP